MSDTEQIIAEQYRLGRNIPKRPGGGGAGIRLHPRRKEAALPEDVESIQGAKQVSMLACTCPRHDLQRPLDP